MATRGPDTPWWPRRTNVAAWPQGQTIAPFVFRMSRCRPRSVAAVTSIATRETLWLYMPTPRGRSPRRPAVSERPTRKRAPLGTQHRVSSYS